MKISLTESDIMTGFVDEKGAEEDAIRAIRLCRANDFPVMIQTNVHRHNLDTLLETAKLMDSLGVWKMRIIRTSEAPRWKEKCR